MKTKNSISIFLALLLNVTVFFSQESNLESIALKYQSSFEENNQGVGILVKRDNQVYTTSIGNHNLTERSVFNIGSATKTFTAILILQEVEKGNIMLTDTIGTYLDPIPNVDGALTIEQLLTHESGLDEVISKNIQDIFYAKSDSLYQDDLLQQVGENDPDMVGKYEYCNTNYFLLGRIIEKLTDQSYFDVLRERIIEPLQLQHTYPYVHKNLPNLATPIHDDRDVTEFLDYRYFANVAFAAGSVASTLIDMEIFYTSLFETDKLLKKETLALLLNSGNDVYGLGIFKPNSKEGNYYGHGGNNIGYSFRNGYNPNTNNLFIIFSNSRKIPQSKVIHSDLMAFTNGETIEQFSEVNIENFKSYAGTYLLAEANLEFVIKLDGDSMYLLVPAQDAKSELTQKNETTLMDTSVGATFSIIEGSTDRLKFKQNGFSTEIVKVTSPNAISEQK
ncbi:serine hydrolase domain-containing protein [Maribacter chungangensis]|uniref:Serine hydrolase domain-containing protein n=1 Tax=Maribacter chungangensis TaxID=1069117 RepID=A0ABW3B5Q0_9FLAO